MKTILMTLMLAACTFAATIEEKNLKIDIFRIAKNGTLEIKFKGFSNSSISNQRFSVPLSSPLYMPLLAVSKEAMKNGDFIALNINSNTMAIEEVALHKTAWN